MRRLTDSRLRRVGGFLVVLAAATLASSAAPAPTVPHPDLSSLPGPARRHVESLQKALEEALEKGASAPGKLPDGFVFLGQVFEAYELPDAAATCYSTALRLAPGNAEWLYARGVVRQGRGDPAGAAADFRAALERDDDLLAAHFHLGDALLALGRPDEAEPVFAEALRRSAPSAAAEYGLGRVAAARGDDEAAVRHLEAALALQPSGTVAHALLAEAYRRLGDAVRAQRHRALRGHGTFSYPDPHRDGLAHIRALTAFETVREMAFATDGFDEARFLDFVLTRFAATPDALDQLRALVASLDAAGDAPAPARGRLRYAAAGLLLRQGRDPEAVGELEAALELAPELLDARLQLGNALARQGRFAEAAAQYDSLLARDANNAEALSKRAAARANLGRMSEARADLEHAAAAAREPLQVAEARTLLAELDLRQERPEAALSDYRRALEADPANLRALAGLAALLGRQGRYREAAATYGALVELSPDDPSARLGEAVALILAGDYAAARARLEAGLAELPDDRSLKAKLARLLAASPDHAARDGRRAAALALEVFAVDPSADTVETLAMAYAEAGDFEQALLWQRRLLSAAGETADPALRRRWERNLERYESGKSCCEGEDDGDPRSP